MTFRKIIATTLFIWLAGVAGAAPFRGVVVDKTTQQALIGATVVVEGTTKGTTTDATGSFELNLAPGDYRIVISYISYFTQQLVRIATRRVKCYKGKIWTIVLNVFRNPKSMRIEGVFDYLSEGRFA